MTIEREKEMLMSSIKDMDEKDIRLIAMIAGRLETIKEFIKLIMIMYKDI